VSELKVNLMTVIKSKVISPFGGLNFVINELDRMQVGKLLNKELPLLRSQSKYDWRNILYSYWSVFFCGGDCAEDLADNFKSYSSLSPYLSVPSPDRVLNRMKELTVPSILEDNETSIQSWLDQTAEKEPAKALDLIFKIAGFVISKPKAETTKKIREQRLFLDEELSLLPDEELQKQLDKAQRVLGLPPIRFTETSKTKFKLIQ
jgi:hypothetical protein